MTQEDPTLKRTRHSVRYSCRTQEDKTRHSALVGPRSNLRTLDKRNVRLLISQPEPPATSHPHPLPLGEIRLDVRRQLDWLRVSV